MKKIFMLGLACLFIVSVDFAAVRTVSNNPNTVAQFNTIQAAVDASSSSDTVYVHGSPTNYAAFTINGKQLVILGPGWSPTKTLPFLAQVFGTCTLTGAGTTGTELQGLIFLGGGIYVGSLGVDNIRFIRNRLLQTLFSINPGVAGTFSGYLFESNWIDNSQINTNAAYTLQNFVFHNNLFVDGGCCVFGNIGGFTNSVNVLFDHNLWYGPASGGRPTFTNSCRFLLITNNIFVHRDAADNNSNSTFNNNITFNSADDTPWLDNGNLNSGGNVGGSDPQMVDEVSVNAGTNNGLLDFTIAAGPANNSGSDGKDMGLLYDGAGSLNWVNTRASRMPYIFSMNITTPTVAPGGNISVSVDSRRSN